MSPVKNAKGRKPKPARKAVTGETAKSTIARSAPVERSRAHTSSVGRRRQARRDSK